MATSDSKKVVIVAFVGNFLIALSKLAAAVITGASSMAAESVHSFADSGNQLLLLYGIKRAKRPPDQQHPFGHSREIYFWSFIVAILLFSAGACFSIYEGIDKILHPHELTSPWINYLVLVAAIIFEGYSFRIALVEFNKRRGGASAFSYVRSSKDAVLFTVLFEDAAALFGLFIALFGLAAAQLLGIAELDGWASVGIGILLAIAAIILSIEIKSLIIGESADPKLLEEVRILAGKEASIAAVNEVLSMQLGPEDILLVMSVDFYDQLNAGHVETSINSLSKRIKKAFPEVRRVFIEPCQS